MTPKPASYPSDVGFSVLRRKSCIVNKNVQSIKLILCMNVSRAVYVCRGRYRSYLEFLNKYWHILQTNEVQLQEVSVFGVCKLVYLFHCCFALKK